MNFRMRNIAVTALVDLPDLVEEIVCGSDQEEVSDFIKALDERVGRTEFTVSLILDLCESLRLDDVNAFWRVTDKLEVRK